MVIIKKQSTFVNYFQSPPSWTFRYFERHWISLKYFYYDHFGNFFERIKHVIRWSRIAWYDSQWDHVQMWKVFRFKLELMKEFFESDKTHLEGSLRNAKEIGRCIRIIKKLETNEHEDRAYGPYEYKWKNGDIVREVEENTETGTVTFLPYDYGSPEREEEHRNDLFKVFAETERMRNDDIKRLMNIIRRHHVAWWD